MIKTVKFAFAVLALLAVSMLPGHIPSASAATPTPPFNQCPPVGANTGCHFLIVINPGGSLTVLEDTTQGPYDGSEDTLIGVVNQSGAAVPKIRVVTSSFVVEPAFGFDGDGLCTYGVAGCPFGTTGYEGPNTSFSNISADELSGDVNFTSPLPNNGTAYFSLEDALTAAAFGPACSPAFTPTKTVSGNVPGSLSVSGKTLIDGATIVGSVAVQPGAEVFIRDSTLKANLSSNNAKTLTMTASTVRGSTSVSGTTGFVTIGGDEACKPNDLAGISLTNNKGGLELSSNRISGSVSVSGNTAPSSAVDPDGGPAATEVENNSIRGSLGCSGNTPAATNGGEPNGVGGSRGGQCAAATF